MSDRIADARGRQRPTPSRRWHFSGRAAAPLRKRSFAYHLEKSESCESGHSRVVTGDHDTIEAERLHPKAAHSRCRPKAVGGTFPAERPEYSAESGRSPVDIYGYTDRNGDGWG